MAADPLAREREDVNKLVSDLIGGGAAPATTSKSPTPKPTDSPTKEPPKPVVPSSKGRVKLVVDQLAPVNIRPKVKKRFITNCSIFETCNNGWVGLHNVVCGECQKPRCWWGHECILRSCMCVRMCKHNLTDLPKDIVIWVNVCMCDDPYRIRSAK